MTTSTPLTRRSLLVGGLSTVAAAALVGCGSSGSRSGSSPSPAGIDEAQARLAALEATFDGRLGVHAVDTGSGAVVSHRAGERFLMCSTFKALAVAAILARADRQPSVLEQVVRYDAGQVIDHSPVTSQHVATGMTVGALCEAASVPSDNTAANLLLGVLGGPEAVTSFARSLGDRVTRLDRTEPTVNRDAPSPGDPIGVLDTSTPAALAGDMQRITLGSVLTPASRQQLDAWLVACMTGVDLVRAGVPAGWRVGDKSGTGYRGEANDLAIVWPPGHAPLIVCILSAPADPSSTTAPATVARAAGIAVAPLVA